MSNINAAVDRLIAATTKNSSKPDELVTEIDPSVFFKYNSVNLVIGRRGSGKTHMVLREILKVMLLGHKEYTQLFYVTDKEHDETFDKLSPLLLKHLQISWINTDEALELLQALEKGKASMDKHPEYRECLNAVGRDGLMPHTFIIFDDAIGLFSKTSNLAKKLYQTRQSRVTAFIILQDVQGLNSSMKSNVDSLVLFGGFSAHKFSILFYHLPPTSTQITFEDYSSLSPQDAVVVDFIDDATNVLMR